MKCIAIVFSRGCVSVVMIDQKIAGKGVILLHGCGPVGPAHRVSYANERVDLNFSQIEGFEGLSRVT